MQSKFNVSHACGLQSDYLETELRLDLEIEVLKEEKYLGHYGYCINDFVCYEITDMKSGRDLTHIIKMPDIWKKVKTEINKLLEIEEQYILSKVDDDE